MPINFSVPITYIWHSAPGGNIPMPHSAGEFVEHHAMLAVGYDDETQLLNFANPWGPSWGDKGYGFLPYAYFESYMTDAWFQFPNRFGRWRPDETDEKFLGRISTLWPAPGSDDTRLS